MIPQILVYGVFPMNMTQRFDNQNKIVMITEKALGQVSHIFQTDPNASGKCLRLSVVGGGCSGLSYKIDFGFPNEKDIRQEYEGFSVIIDPKSAIYLKDVEVDFQDGLNGKGFTFKNPNAAGSCGCGESFSV